MQDATQDLILEELRALRNDFNTYARDTGERVASLETDMHALVGNGNPGRVALIEASVAKLSQWRWYVIGTAFGGGTVVSALAYLIVEGRK
jgi:hypothetical protein